MNLQLVIIHNDMVIDSLSLAPGDYKIGRSKSSNIVVQHFSLHRDQGLLFFEEGQWFYKDQQSGRTQIINDSEAIELSGHISIATAQYVEMEKTHLSDFATIHKKRRTRLKQRLAIVSTMTAVLLLFTVVGYNIFRTDSYPMTENNLLKEVRSKIVEFEANRDERAINDLKKYAGLKDSDFKEASGFCTGFLVAPNVVLTASHCLFGGMVIDLSNDFHLKTHDGKEHKVLSVLGFDIKRDYLYLETEGMESYGHLEFAPEFHIEQKVFTVGNVHGEGIAIRDGIISSETTDLNDPDIKYIRYSAGASPGNSGGPLLDEFGRIVALVFASTWSENFNLGTSATDLKAGFEQFVSQKKKGQKVTIAVKKIMNFNAQTMLQALSLPYLNQFDEYPEVIDQFSEVAVEVQVPIPFESVDEVILGPLNAAVILAFETVQKILKENHEIVLDWTSFVTKKTPAILPSQLDFSQSYMVKVGGRYYPKIAGFIDSPSKSDFTKYVEQFEKENKFDFQSYGYNITETDKKIGISKESVFYKPKNNSGTKLRLQDLAQGVPYSQLVLESGYDFKEQSNPFNLQLFLKNFLGDQGVLANAASLFVRPNSVKDFTIKNIELKDLPEPEAVSDSVGRTWLRSSIKLFESTTLYTYCLKLPEGPLCIGRIFNITNDFLLKTIEGNFRKFILSHLIINPYFWDKGDLLKYMKAGRAKFMPSMRGIEFSEQTDPWVKLKSFPFRFKIPNFQNIQSLRLQSGLYGTDGKVAWTGYGVEWVDASKDKAKVCGIGLEPFNSQSSFILNYLRDRRKQEKLKKIKGEDPDPLPGVWYRPFRGYKDPFQIFGYCAPLEEDPRVAGQYFIDFKNSKVLLFDYKVGG